MKSKIKSKADDSTIETYPCLAQLKVGELVVLFNRKRSGTVLHTTIGDWDIGDVDDSFHMDLFELYDGTLELSN